MLRGRVAPLTPCGTLRLDRKPIGDELGPVENLQGRIADRTAILSFRARFGPQLQPLEPGPTARAGYVRFFHIRVPKPLVADDTLANGARRNYVLWRTLLSSLVRLR